MFFPAYCIFRTIKCTGL